MPGTAKPRLASRGRIWWTARVMVARGAGGTLAWVAAALPEGALVGGGPRVGQLDDQVGQVLPRQPGEDRMGEGRTGPCWLRHPCMITRAARLMRPRRSCDQPRLSRTKSLAVGGGSGASRGVAAAGDLLAAGGGGHEAGQARQAVRV